MTAIILVSLLAAFLFGLSAVLQQHAASRGKRSGTPEGGLSLMKRLVRSRTWLAGQGSNLGGFFSQAGALKVGSVGVVQPLITTELLFAIGLDALTRKRKLTPAEIAGGVAVCGGLVLFLSVRAASPTNGLPDRSRLLLIAPCVAGIVAALVAAGRYRRTRPIIRAILLGVGAGIFFACSAVLIKLTTYDLFDRGVAATATDWPGYSMALTTSAGLVLEQMAFASGPLQPGMTAMTITNPVVSYAFALVAFRSPAPHTPGSVAAVAGAAVLMTTGVVLAGRSAERLKGRASSGEPPGVPGVDAAGEKGGDRNPVTSA